MQKTIVYICGFVVMFALGGCATSSLKPSQFESYKIACEQGDGGKCYSLGRMYMKGIGTDQNYSKAGEAYKRGCEKGNNKNACREFGKLQSDGLGERSSGYAVKQPSNHRQTSPALNPSQFESYKIACEQGDGDKCYSLGRMYMEGNGTNQSYSKARKAYKRGCEQRSYSTMEACYALGKIYANGLGVRKNYNKAQKLFEHTCKANDTKGCGDLGHMYLYGNGVKKNYSQAIKLLKKGCEHNDAKACSTLSTLSDGLSERPDDYAVKQPFNHRQTAPVLKLSQFESYKIACEQGDGDKCYSLGRMYMEGNGTDQNYAKARKAYKQGCEQRSYSTMEACYALGKIYANGLGVGRNYNKAQKLFEHTCKASDTKGCGDLGHMYLYGKGVKKNYSQAIELLRKGCEHNDAKACSTLGTLYITGQVMKEDYKKAYGLFDKSCRAGDALGCYNMGNIYENGIGRAQSKLDAIRFYNLACSAGLQEGCQSLKLLQ